MIPTSCGKQKGRAGRAGWRAHALASLLALALARIIEPAMAQTPPTAPPASKSLLGGDLSEGQIETTADRLNYDREHGVVEGIGHVVLTRGDVVLRANYVRVNVETQVAHANGDVTLTRGKDVWTGPTLDYNFKTGAGGSTAMIARAPPFYVRAERSERQADGRFILYNAWASTCDPDEGDVDYHITAKKMELKPDKSLKAYNAVWWFGPVPSMYVPYWYRDLDNDFGWTVQPGYSSDDGAFLLTAYHYRLSEGLTGRTHLDYRTERGVAGGQDFGWNYGGNQHVGDFKAYYADDQDPMQDEDVAAGKDITADRYRLRLHDRYNATDRDVILARVHYLSDTDVIDDFFQHEYRLERQPDNYVSTTHRGDGYSANGIVRSRVNDFYDNVNRLPEGSLDVYRMQLGDSELYYESESAAAFLQQVYAEGSDNEEYDSARFDTKHTLYRPDKLFGFLTLVPRAGARATYYSQTKSTETVREVIPVTTTTPVVSPSGVTNVLTTTGTTTNTVTRDISQGADLRGSMELGFETSYKSFGLYDTAYGPRRHIIEPFANYTYIPEPNLTPEDLYQFDSVDQVDQQNTLLLGVRNKWQEKRKTGAYDIIDFEVYTTVNIHRPEGQDTLETVSWDGEFRPVDGVAIDMDGAWSVPESKVQTQNTWLVFDGLDWVRTRIEHRYRVDESNVLFGDVTLFPDGRWSYNFYAREEFEDNQLQDVGGYIQHTFTCLGLRLGGSVLPGYTRRDGSTQADEYRFMLEMWLTAFPEKRMGGGGGYGE